MATAEAAQQPVELDGTDRPSRRRPFSTWVKKIANFKSASTDTNASSHPTPAKRNTSQIKSHSKRLTASKKNNPYPESGYVNGHSSIPNANGRGSFSTGPTSMSRSTPSLNQSRNSVRSSHDGHSPPTIGNKSMAATVSTAAHSEAAASHAPSSGQGTNATNGCGLSTGQGADSTFSSPTPSVRSLTTTLTTIQSVSGPAAHIPHQTSNTNNQTMQFSHQFPISPPPSALPAHLAPSGSGGHPPTYNTATANNLLTDNASILTLASSSKRRRRRSMDTDASVRALAPSSLFGGSRESLPLSVLSANIDPSNVPPTPHQPRPSLGGLNERASIYSATGVAPALPSERNSYYAGKQSILADGGSVKSGLAGHGRNDSTSGSIGGIAASGSPLSSPKDTAGPSSAGRLSRTNSGWGEVDDADKVEEPNGGMLRTEASKSDVPKADQSS
ncbi:Uncharacterized protein BP5553_05403 [Venustampulla echinocandica]|uniref:Ca2+-modulated nonselective cation channel polycystin n=1 Tax=Venustampulla echinocandica TaxID=2656787 RepID=A0A370TR11_9HELO|nr:Uncharacterized protein BP5553_05403 [Venustampulla echinocandica]RDL37970.1 Uncharacterized protein BP5553_05403 [Venustampulla echinocandica]